MSFQVRHTTSAGPLPRRWFTWDWNEQKFNLGAVVALGTLLLLSFAVPPSGVTVSNDLLAMGNGYVQVPVIPFVPEPIPDIFKPKPDTSGGGGSEALAGAKGQAGNRDSKKHGRLAIEGTSPVTKIGQAEAEAKIRNSSILGVLNSAKNPALTSVFSRDSAIGDAKESLIGNLWAANVGEGWGTGGWNVVGTGNGGGGFGTSTIGLSGYHTLGGEGYGRGTGKGPGFGPGGGAGLRPHATVIPNVISGSVTTRGSLDKEIVRRVVRLHMNEVKYCYDKELVTKPSLEGRVSVQFVIAATGQVISSVMNSTTMNNVNVEKCVVDAVKRWPFPAPSGGGIVIVAYPFNFSSGGR